MAILRRLKLEAELLGTAIAEKFTGVPSTFRGEITLGQIVTDCTNFSWKTFGSKYGKIKDWTCSGLEIFMAAPIDLHNEDPVLHKKIIAAINAELTSLQFLTGIEFSLNLTDRAAGGQVVGTLSRFAFDGKKVVDMASDYSKIAANFKRNAGKINAVLDKLGMPNLGIAAPSQQKENYNKAKELARFINTYGFKNFKCELMRIPPKEREGKVIEGLHFKVDVNFMAHNGELAHNLARQLTELCGIDFVALHSPIYSPQPKEMEGKSGVSDKWYVSARYLLASEKEINEHNPLPKISQLETCFIANAGIIAETIDGAVNENRVDREISSNAWKMRKLSGRMKQTIAELARQPAEHRREELLKVQKTIAEHIKELEEKASTEEKPLSQAEKVNLEGPENGGHGK